MARRPSFLFQHHLNSVEVYPCVADGRAFLPPHMDERESLSLFVLFDGAMEILLHGCLEPQQGILQGRVSARVVCGVVVVGSFGPIAHAPLAMSLALLFRRKRLTRSRAVDKI